MVGSILAWGALKLVSSLVSEVFTKLAGDDNDASIVEWSGDVIYKASGKSQASTRRSPCMAAFSQAQEASHPEMRRGLSGDRSEFEGLRRDFYAIVREMVEESREENQKFYTSFEENLKATQEGIDILRGSPLKEAESYLTKFKASDWDLQYLEQARQKAHTALFQGHTLDVRLRAAMIEVSADYVYQSKKKTPRYAKEFILNSTLTTIVDTFSPEWTKDTSDKKKVLSFLLNVVACACVLPPEDVVVLPTLDERLLPAFGALCAADPELRGMYPVVSFVAVGAILKAKRWKNLIQLAEEVDVDIEHCETRVEIVQTLHDSGTILGPWPATDREALMVLFNDTGGDSWNNQTGWGGSEPLDKWHGVAVDGEGRVVKLHLRNNNLNGQLPPELESLTNLETLVLSDNRLKGPVPKELGYLSRLKELDLSINDFTGSIPKALANASSLEILRLQCNDLHGSVPPINKLGNLKEFNADWDTLDNTDHVRDFLEKSPQPTEAEIKRAESRRKSTSDSNGSRPDKEKAQKKLPPSMWKGVVKRAKGAIKPTEIYGKKRSTEEAP
eukprot:g15026.t1